MQERTTGYALLAVGILIMVISAIIVIMVFTGIMQPVQVFDIKAPTLNTSDIFPQLPGSRGQELEVVPTEAFNNTLNMTVQFFLMTFLLNLGFKLSDLGVKLVRPIKVEAKEGNSQSN